MGWLSGLFKERTLKIKKYGLTIKIFVENACKLRKEEFDECCRIIIDILNKKSHVPNKLRIRLVNGKFGGRAVNGLIELNPKYKEYWLSMLTHELEHYYMQKYSESYRIYQKSQKRLQTLLAHLPDKLETLADIRLLLRDFLYGIWLEGLADVAKLIAENGEEVVRDRQRARVEFEKAVTNAYRLRKILELALKNPHLFTKEKIKKSIGTYLAQYNIGKGIVWLVLAYFPYKLSDLRHISPMKLLKLQERICDRLGIKPAFTWSSGKGELDYARLLRIWHSTVKHRGGAL